MREPLCVNGRPCGKLSVAAHGSAAELATLEDILPPAARAALSQRRGGGGLQSLHRSVAPNRVSRRSVCVPVHLARLLSTYIIYNPLEAFTEVYESWCITTPLRVVTEHSMVLKPSVYGYPDGREKGSF